MQYANHKIDNMKIGLLLIATKKYKQFLQNLINDVKIYFFVNDEIEVHLFCDETEYEVIGDERVKIIKDLIPPYSFPLATLLRYKIFVSKVYDVDFLLYMDVDMRLVHPVGREMIASIVAVKHPGFEKMGGGSWEANKDSNAYTYPENRNTYYAGGVQGGLTEKYYRLMQRMARDIDDDAKRNVTPIWHDESVWNFYLSQMKSFLELGCAYCMPEPKHLREQWHIDHIQPRIIALDKKHLEIRS